MPNWTIDAPVIASAYFIGAIPFGYLVARAVGRVDIRTKGSGNIGATNVGRVLGRKWGVFVFILDVLKGFLPVLGVLAIHGRGIGPPDLPPAAALAGVAAIAGHNWPIFLRFKGGKGVATSCGIMLAIFPRGLAISLGVWIVVVALTRYVSLGSMLGGLALLACACLLQRDPFAEGIYLTAFAGLAAVLSIVRHRGNIGRLLQGTENKIGAGQKQGK